MSLLEARQVAWDEIIEEMTLNLEQITLIHEKRAISVECGPPLKNAKEMSIRNSHFALKFIHFLNERTTEELRPMDKANRISAVVDISKVI